MWTPLCCCSSTIHVGVLPVHGLLERAAHASPGTVNCPVVRGVSKGNGVSRKDYTTLACTTMRVWYTDLVFRRISSSPSPPPVSPSSLTLATHRTFRATFASAAAAEGSTVTQARVVAAAAADTCALVSGDRPRDPNSASLPSADTANAGDCGARGVAENEDSLDQMREDESSSIAEGVGLGVVVPGGRASGTATRKDSPRRGVGRASSARGVGERSAVTDVHSNVHSKGKDKVAREWRMDQAEVEDSRHVVKRRVLASPSSCVERPTRRVRPKHATRAASDVDDDSHEKSAAVPAEVVGGSAVTDATAAVPNISKNVKRKGAKTTGASNVETGATSAGNTASGNEGRTIARARPRRAVPRPSYAESIESLLVRRYISAISPLSSSAGLDGDYSGSSNTTISSTGVKGRRGSGVGPASGRAKLMSRVSQQLLATTDKKPSRALADGNVNKKRV